MQDPGAPMMLAALAKEAGLPECDHAPPPPPRRLTAIMPPFPRPRLVSSLRLIRCNGGAFRVKGGVHAKRTRFLRISRYPSIKIIKRVLSARAPGCRSGVLNIIHGTHVRCHGIGGTNRGPGGFHPSTEWHRRRE